MTLKFLESIILRKFYNMREEQTCKVQAGIPAGLVWVDQTCTLQQLLEHHSTFRVPTAKISGPIGSTAQRHYVLWIYVIEKCSYRRNARF